MCPYCNCNDCICGAESDWFDHDEMDDYLADLEFEMIEEAGDGDE